MLLTLLFACKNDKKEPQGSKIESISFKQESYTSNAGGAAGLNLRNELKITPASIADTCKVTWALSDPSVANITENGVITPVKEGETKVTATVQGMSAQCKYTVKVVHVTGVTVDPAEYAENVKIGSTRKLTVKIEPEDATFQTVEWTSSNTAVASVSSDGTVTCKGEGKCTIKATVDGKSGSCAVTYSPNIVHVTSVIVTPSTYSAEGKAGTMKKLTATVKPDNATVKTVTWKSSNTSLAIVSTDGTVSCVGGVGTVTITATADGVEGKCTITYSKVKVTSVEVTPSSYTEPVKIGATKKLTAKVLPDDATDKTVTWRSNNQAVATVSSDGTVTCRSVGGAVITATADGKTGTCYVTYEKVPVTKVKISRPGLAFNTIGQTYKLTAEVEPSNATYKDVTWSSTNTSVATVDNNGLVTCKGFGAATISAKADEKSDAILVLSNQDYVIDGCGYVYTSKKIGTQVWMLQNMRCDTYDTQSERAGETLSSKYDYINASDKSRWKDSYSGLDNSQVSQLGYIYHWWAAVGLEFSDYETEITGRRQGICPNGWHLPTDAEWKTLENFLGSSTAGKMLKTTSGWFSSGNGTDAYSFAALPAGYGYSTVEGVGSYACFWTATPSSDRDDTAIARGLEYNNDKMKKYQYEFKPVNLSVRCVKN